MKTLDFWKDKLKQTSSEAARVWAQLRSYSEWRTPMPVKSVVRVKMVSRKGRGGLFRKERRPDLRGYGPMRPFKTSRSRAKKNFRRKVDLEYRARIKQQVKLTRLWKKLNARESYFRERIRALENRSLWDTIRKGGLPL